MSCGERTPLQLAVVEPFGELRGGDAVFDHMSGVRHPERRPGTREAGEREVAPLGLVDQPVQVLDRIREPRRIDQGRCPGEPGADQQISVADAFGDLDRLAEERDRLLFRPCPRRDVGRHQEVLGGLRVIAGLAVVVRQDRGGFPDTVTRLALDERRDHAMTLPARGPRQRPVGDLACEHMLEDELSIGDHARGRLAVG